VKNNEICNKQQRMPSRINATAPPPQTAASTKRSYKHMNSTENQKEKILREAIGNKISLYSHCLHGF